MLNAIIIMLKRAAGVVRRIDVDTLDPAREFLFKCFEGEQVVAEYQPVIEQITVGHAMRGVISLRRVFQQYARFESGPVLFADPRQFEFRPFGHNDFINRENYNDIQMGLSLTPRLIAVRATSQ
jgi:hypothetical protein